MNVLSHTVALAFLAHPDDAEILCAGTLLRLKDMGWTIHIATATSGDCGSTTLEKDAIARIRRDEAINSARLLGAHYHCLEEMDVGVVFSAQTNQKAIDLFRQVSPSLVFTHPRHDYMLDHEQVHILARSASFAYAIPNASPLPLLEHSCIPWLYYCDPIGGVDPYSGEEVGATVLVNVTREMDRKLQMLACHASQREWLKSHHGMDEYMESMKRQCAHRGRLMEADYAEAFVQHVGHAYPQTDLLACLFSEEPFNNDACPK